MALHYIGETDHFYAGTFFQLDSGATMNIAGTENYLSGATVLVNSGVTFAFASGSTVTVDGVALNPICDALTGTSPGRITKVAVVALAAGVDTAGGLASWVNPEAGNIIITRAEVYYTTIATAACTVSVGTTSVSATTLSANLITGCDVHGVAAPNLYDNVTDIGASGKSRQVLPAGKWVTASTASGASAGLVGILYIEYHLP